jgi:hypothetical protein
MPARPHPRLPGRAARRRDVGPDSREGQGKAAAWSAAHAANGRGSRPSSLATSPLTCCSSRVGEPRMSRVPATTFGGMKAPIAAAASARVSSTNVTSCPIGGADGRGLLAGRDRAGSGQLVHPLVMAAAQGDRGAGREVRRVDHRQRDLRERRGHQAPLAHRRRPRVRVGGETARPQDRPLEPRAPSPAAPPRTPRDARVTPHPAGCVPPATAAGPPGARQPPSPHPAPRPDRSPRRRPPPARTAPRRRRARDAASPHRSGRPARAGPADWGSGHLGNVEQARAAYDGHQAIGA